MQRQNAKEVAHIIKDGRKTPQALPLNPIEAYNKGVKDGIHGIDLACYETYFAAAALAAHELFGFGQDRCYRLVHQMAIYARQLSDDLEDAVRLKCKLDMDFSDRNNLITRRMSDEEWKRWKETGRTDVNIGNMP